MLFSVELAAIDTSRNCRRRYRIEAAQDLLGAWLVTVTFGRLGSVGRSVTYVVDDEDQARRTVRACLRRRASAPRRIGVPYRVRDLHASSAWADIGNGIAMNSADASPASA